MGIITHIKADGSVVNREAESIKMKELQEMVGGWVERTQIRWNGKLVYMWVDEDGHSKGRQINVQATKLYQSMRHTEHCIVGDVVILLKVKLKD